MTFSPTNMTCPQQFMFFPQNLKSSTMHHGPVSLIIMSGPIIFSDKLWGIDY